MGMWSSAEAFPILYLSVKRKIDIRDKLVGAETETGAEGQIAGVADG